MNDMQMQIRTAVKYHIPVDFKWLHRQYNNLWMRYNIERLKKNKKQTNKQKETCAAKARD